MFCLHSCIFASLMWPNTQSMRQRSSGAEPGRLLCELLRLGQQFFFLMWNTEKLCCISLTLLILPLFCLLPIYMYIVVTFNSISFSSMSQVIVPDFLLTDR